MRVFNNWLDIVIIVLIIINAICRSSIINDIVKAIYKEDI